MNNSSKKVTLPSAPTLIGSSEFDQIYELVKTLGESSKARGQDEIGDWDAVIEKYRIWEQSFVGSHTSTTNRMMYLLQLLREAYPHLSLKDDPRFTAILLSGLHKPGDLVRMKLPDGTTGNAKVVRREITERLGVLFTMESDEGFLFAHEFFD